MRGTFQHSVLFLTEAAGFSSDRDRKRQGPSKILGNVLAPELPRRRLGSGVPFVAPHESFQRIMATSHRVADGTGKGKVPGGRRRRFPTDMVARSSQKTHSHRDAIAQNFPPRNACGERKALEPSHADTGDEWSYGGAETVCRGLKPNKGLGGLGVCRPTLEWDQSEGSRLQQTRGAPWIKARKLGKSSLRAQSMAAGHASTSSNVPSFLTHAASALDLAAIPAGEFHLGMERQGDTVPTEKKIHAEGTMEAGSTGLNYVRTWKENSNA